MRRFVAICAVLLVLVCPACALTDADYLRMKRDPGFAQADTELTEIWNQLRRGMPSKTTALLRRNQRNWIAGGRDFEAKRLMLRGYTRTGAYTEATRRRTDELPMLAERFFAQAENGKKWYFSRVDDGRAFLSIAWNGRAPGIVTVSFSVDGSSWSTSASYDQGIIEAVDQMDGNCSVVMLFSEDDDVVEVETSDLHAFRRRGILPRGVSLDGVYERHYGK